MTRDQWINKWANHLAGKFTRFAFAEVTGPGLEGRVRQLVQDIDKAMAEAWAEAQAPANVNGQPAKRMESRPT